MLRKKSAVGLKHVCSLCGIRQNHTMAYQSKPMAFLFPGQGCQKIGMGKTLYDNSTSLIRDIYDQGQLALKDEGVDLLSLMWHGPEHVLNQTENAQPAILLHSYASFISHCENDGFGNPSQSSSANAYFLGHSLGEYSALVAMGALSFSDALRIVRHRGLCMKEAVSRFDENLGMIALLFKSMTHQLLLPESLMTYLKEHHHNHIEVANENSDTEVVLAGNLQHITSFCEDLKQRRICNAFKRLAVSAPFHSSFMKPALSPFIFYLDKLPLKIPDNLSGVFVSSCSAKEVKFDDVTDLKNYFKQQLIQPVLWRKTIQHLRTLGNVSYVECGANVLTKFNKSIQ